MIRRASKAPETGEWMPVDSNSQRNKSMTQFGQDDYGMDTGSSAVAITDLVLKYLNPTSVVDVGCGTGVFLEEFKKRGADTILGLDGPATRAVYIPDESNFVAVDLTRPVELNQRFDLALCLEVAEHLQRSQLICSSRHLPTLLLSCCLATLTSVRVDRTTSTSASRSLGAGASPNTTTSHWTFSLVR